MTDTLPPQSAAWYRFRPNNTQDVTASEIAEMLKIANFGISRALYESSGISPGLKRHFVPE